MADLPIHELILMARKGEDVAQRYLAMFVLTEMTPGQRLTYNHNILCLFQIHTPDRRDEYKNELHRMQTMLGLYTTGRCTVWQETLTGHVTIERTL
jgi:hypothetical protein